MQKVIPILSLEDNYIWLLINTASHKCLIFDPGEADPVIDFLENQRFTPEAILVTHHHADHTAGINELCRRYPSLPVYGSAHDTIAHRFHQLRDQDSLHFPGADARFNVIAIPGHTLNHIAFYGQNAVFTGDTLFSGGCGRVFEGTFEQMYASLMTIASLPVQTAVYCGHEYTIKNLTFAAVVEPNNASLIKHFQHAKSLRVKHLPTLPTSIAQEKSYNPFLRCEEPDIIQSVQAQYSNNATDPVSVFKLLRQWKDNFA